MCDDLGELRKRAGLGYPLSQAEVARLLGLRRQTVHAIERRALAKLRAALERADGCGTHGAMAGKREPRQPVRHPPRPKSDRHREQYGVIVLCRDEPEQRRVYERLHGQGLRVRVVVT